MALSRDLLGRYTWVCIWPSLLRRGSSTWCSLFPYRAHTLASTSARAYASEISSCDIGSLRGMLSCAKQSFHSAQAFARILHPEARTIALETKTHKGNLLGRSHLKYEENLTDRLHLITCSRYLAGLYRIAREQCRARYLLTLENRHVYLVACKVLAHNRTRTTLPDRLHLMVTAEGSLR